MQANVWLRACAPWLSRTASVFLALGLASSVLPSCGISTGGGDGSGGEDPGDPGDEEPGPDAGDRAMAAHALRRLAYGPTPDELDAVTQSGVSVYVDKQLQPDLIQETQAFRNLLAQVPFPQTPYGTTGLRDLEQYQLLRAIYSRKQLQEQMVQFWENHFNTDYETVFKVLGGPAQTRATYLEWEENEIFRSMALGSFRDLLIASATSPTMLMFLDNVSNTKGEPNENYAREVMELFTMGVDNGYTEADVEQVARCFTGWSVCTVQPQDHGDPFAVCDGSGEPVWSFRFKKGLHDEGAKTIFAGTPYELHVPARTGEAGMQDGFDVLNHLADLPHTSQYVSTKLIQKFVSDTPPPALVAACQQRWAQTDGSMRAVMRTILESSHFRTSLANRWNKVRTPMESLCATVRALEGTITRPGTLDSLRIQMDGVLNHQLFRWATPDGYPEHATAQTGTGKLLGNYTFKKFVYDVPFTGIVYDFRGTLHGQGVALNDPEGIVDYFGDLLFHGNFSQEERNLALDFLLTDEAGNPAPLSTSREDYDDRVHLLAVYLLGFPQFFQQ